MVPIVSRRAVPLLVLALAACAAEPGLPTAEFRLMDAPPPGVTSVRVFVDAIEAHVDDKTAKAVDPADTSIDKSDKWVTLPVRREIDLLAHQGEDAAEILGQLDLPEGKITQIRLILDTKQANTATVDGAVCALDTSKVDPKGIKIDHAFKAFEANLGDRHVIWVDVPLDGALEADGKGCFVLEPKLKLHRVRTNDRDIQLL